MRKGFLYPPMIDAGTAIGLSEISSVADTVDVSENGDFQPDIKAQTAIQAASAHIGVAACHGIMLAVSRPSGGLVSGQATILQMHGDNNDELTRVQNFAMTVSIPGAPPSRPFKETHGCRCFGTTLEELLNGPIHDHGKENEIVTPQTFLVKDGSQKPIMTGKPWRMSQKISQRSRSSQDVSKR